MKRTHVTKSAASFTNERGPQPLGGLRKSQPAPAFRSLFTEAMQRRSDCRLTDDELFRIAMEAYRACGLVPWVDPLADLAAEMGINVAEFDHWPPDVRNVQLAHAMAVALLEDTAGEDSFVDACHLLLELVAPRPLVSALCHGYRLTCPDTPDWFVAFALARADVSSVSRPSVTR